MSVFTIVGLSLLAPLMMPYLERRIAPDQDHFQVIFSTIPTFKSYFFSQKGSLMWDFLSNVGAAYDCPWKHQIFTGVIASVALTAMFGWNLLDLAKKKLLSSPLTGIHMLALTAMLSTLIFLRIGDFSLYALVYEIPGFSSMRLITRIINVHLLFFGVGVSFIGSHLLKSRNYTYAAIFLCALALLVCDNYFMAHMSYRTKVEVAQARTEALDQAFATIPEGSIVSYEPIHTSEEVNLYHIGAMLSAQKYNLVTVNGYTARSPLGYSGFWQKPHQPTRNEWLGRMHTEADTLYVVKSAEEIDKVAMETIRNDFFLKTYESHIKALIERIEQNEDWMQLIRQKAEEKQISVDSMLELDARWLLQNQDADS